MLHKSANTGRITLALKAAVTFSNIEKTLDKCLIFGKVSQNWAIFLKTLKKPVKFVLQQICREMMTLFNTNDRN